MGQAKRRKQVDPNYGNGFGKELEREKFVIELGNFINSSEVPNLTKGLQFKKSGIKDSGLCVAFAIKGFKLAGVAFPSVEAVEGKGKICVGIITYSLDNDLSASEADKLTRTVRSAESEIRRVVAEAYKAKFYS
jgi:hypothetical protein